MNRREVLLSLAAATGLGSCAARQQAQPLEPGPVADEFPSKAPPQALADDAIVTLRLTAANARASTINAALNDVSAGGTLELDAPSIVSVKLDEPLRMQAGKSVRCGDGIAFVPARYLNEAVLFGAVDDACWSGGTFHLNREIRDGIAVAGGSGNTVRRVHVNSPKIKGLKVDGKCTDLQVTDSTFAGAISEAAAGISLFGGTVTDAQILRCLLVGNRLGITLNASSNTLVEHCHCIDNYHIGLIVDSINPWQGNPGQPIGTGNLIRNSIFERNAEKAAFYGGVYLGSSEGAIPGRNTLENLISRDNFGAGIRVRDVPNVTIRGCTLTGNGYYGLRVDGADGSRVENTLIRDNKKGDLERENTTDFTLENTRIR